MRWKKLGLVYRRNPAPGWWHSHTMAPSAVQLDAERIRVFLGCWDQQGISRIGYLDVSADNPTRVLDISAHPILDLGAPGCFDDNGVFPAHATRIGNAIHLHYTGFQLGEKVRYFNFGGLAIGDATGEHFVRISQAPVLDRADEGLTVRAGVSVLPQDGHLHAVYSAGSSWQSVGGAQRPMYDVFYQTTPDGQSFQRAGQRIVAHDPQIEHGLGRPQLVNLGSRFGVFYTRRTLDMHYHFGLALSDDLRTWQRADHLADIPHDADFDREMVYFPSFIHLPSHGRSYLFYSGNGFGRDGLGVAELERIA